MRFQRSGNTHFINKIIVIPYMHPDPRQRRIIQRTESIEIFSANFRGSVSSHQMILKKDTVKIDDDIINNSSENIETRVLLGQTIGHKGV